MAPPAYYPTYAITAVGGGKYDRRLKADTLVELCEGLIGVNTVWRKRFPKTLTFLESKVRYHDDSRVVCSRRRGECRFIEDHWADWPRCLSFLYGDCEDLACEVVAEERLAGRRAWPLPRCYKCDPRAHCPECGDPVKSRLTVNGDLWHIQAAIEDPSDPDELKIADPSRERGMPAHSDGDDVVVSKLDQILLTSRMPTPAQAAGHRRFAGSLGRFPLR